jgi:hypothetical protein
MLDMAHNFMGLGWQDRENNGWGREALTARMATIREKYNFKGPVSEEDFEIDLPEPLDSYGGAGVNRNPQISLKIPDRWFDLFHFKDWGKLSSVKYKSGTIFVDLKTMKVNFSKGTKILLDNKEYEYDGATFQRPIEKQQYKKAEDAKVVLKDILNKTKEAYSKRISGIQDLTILDEQEITGLSKNLQLSKEGTTVQMTYYFKRLPKSGFDTRSEPYPLSVAALKLTYNPSKDWKTFDEYRSYPTIVVGPYEVFFSISYENMDSNDAKYQGIEKLTDGNAHVLSIPNMIKFVPSQITASDNTKIKGAIWIDANDFIIKKIKLETEILNGDTITDYSEVIEYIGISQRDKIMIPSITIVSLGINISKPLTAKEKKALESIGDEEREFLGKEAIQSFQEKGQHVENSNSWITKVKEVKVNTGLKDEIFGK